MPFWESQQSLTYIEWILRATVAFFWLLLVTKLIGQREIGRLTLFDFIVAITIGSVLAASLSSSTSSLTNALLTISVIGILDIVLAFTSLKYSKFRRLVQEEPIVLIKDGQILKDTLRKTRITLDDLLMELRQKNFPNLSDIEFAILEQNGKVSVIPKSQARPVRPQDLKLPTQYEGLPSILIEDGNIVEDNLNENNLSKEWLLNKLKELGIENEKSVFTAMLDTTGRFYVSGKN